MHSYVKQRYKKSNKCEMNVFRESRRQQNQNTSRQKDSQAKCRRLDQTLSSKFGDEKTRDRGKREEDGTRSKNESGVNPLHGSQLPTGNQKWQEHDYDRTQTVPDDPKNQKSIRFLVLVIQHLHRSQPSKKSLPAVVSVEPESWEKIRIETLEMFLVGIVKIFGPYIRLTFSILRCYWNWHDLALSRGSPKSGLASAVDKKCRCWPPGLT